MTFDLAAYFREGLDAARWNDVDLWLATVAIGTGLELGATTAITNGDQEPTVAQYDMLAFALNERLADLGYDHPMRAWNDLPHPPD
jgi:hypothetical protein